MYFKSNNAMWDEADHDKRTGAKNIGYVEDKLRAVSGVSTFNEEVLLMWRGYIELKYLSVVDDHGKTTEPYQDFVHRVRALRSTDLTLYALYANQLRKKRRDNTRERVRGWMTGDSQEVSACA